MSTILNTLKKLEEEKSVLDKNIDLKGLLLQGQDSAYPQSNEMASRKWGTLGGLILGGLILGGLIVYFFNFSKTTPPETKNAFALPKSSSTAVAKKPLKNAKSYPGFPLARIPDSASLATADPMTDSFEDEVFFVAEDEVPLPVLPLPTAMAEPEPQGAEEIREIESLIQTATADRTHQETASVDFDETLAFAGGNTRNIPGLKVKGIIFLNSDNPVNHIFVSTPHETNRKLKVGETLQNATLESIEAQTAVFSYQGERVEKAVGE